MYTNSHPHGAQFPKQYFARNIMKCPYLHTDVKNLEIDPIPNADEGFQT